MVAMIAVIMAVMLMILYRLHPRKIILTTKVMIQRTTTIHHLFTNHLLGIIVICSKTSSRRCLLITICIVIQALFFGSVLVPSYEHAPAMPLLANNDDDGSFVPLESQRLNFEQRTQLLHLNWDVLHTFTTLLDVRSWLESLPKDKHLLLVPLYEAYWVIVPDATLSFGVTKAKFWNAVNNASTFINHVFVVQQDVPLAAATIESFWCARWDNVFNSCRIIIWWFLTFETFCQLKSQILLP